MPNPYHRSYVAHFNARLFECRPYRGAGNDDCKKPLHKGWQKSQLTDEQLEAIESPLGWALGPRDVVIDVDFPTEHRPDKVGDKSWERLEKDLGINMAEDTIMVDATTGGCHLCYTLPEGVDASMLAGQLRGYKDIDIKKYGGYVIIAGSKHWEGGQYEIGSRVALVQNWKRAELSGKLLELCLKEVKPEQSGSTDDAPAQPTSNGLSTASQIVTDQHDSAYGAKALEDELSQVRLALPGRRNGTLNRAAFCLSQLAAGGCLPYDWISQLSDAARDAGLEPDEIKKTIHSGRSAGKKTPRAPTPRDATDPMSMIDVIDDTGILVSNGTSENSSSVVAAMARKKNTVKSFAGRAYHGDLEHDAKIPPEWFVQDLFQTNVPTAFLAASKATKTTQLIDLSVSLASGAPWLGTFEIPKPLNVLFVTGESSDSDIARKMERCVQSKGISSADTKDRLRVEANEFPKLILPVDLIGVERAIKEYGFDVIILDPLYRALSGLDTHRMAEVAEAVVVFCQMCRELGATAIISHHTVKSAAREMKVPKLEDCNGSGIPEACGNWWLLARTEEYQGGTHQLAANWGGRNGQWGGVQLQFDEPNWGWSTVSAEEAEANKERCAAESRRNAKGYDAAEVRAETLRRLIESPRSQNWLEENIEYPKQAVRAARETLQNEGLIERRNKRWSVVESTLEDAELETLF